MKQPDEILSAAEELGITSEEMCVRLAKKLGIDKRVIVRSRSGELRIVQPGEKLRLSEGEFIANLHPRIIRESAKEVVRLANAGRKVHERDLD